ncbi:MAG TPA: tRNA lysidine(34) synthetase TilS [Bacteroidales bacterium]|nr:tRNA lysidine(34) synthetase TilS [Bacteroidales bacterium]
MLYNKFRLFAKKHNLFDPEEKIILAVSGGIDSMVMMSLFARMEAKCIVAHCNFSLRDEESDGDEQFVRDQVAGFGLPIAVKRFDTKGYAATHKLSIQMAARELRYNWFSQLCDEHKCRYVAVAHNKDDVLETFFINLGRGTGIKGLTGIQPKTDQIIRPLLFASRADITAYSNEAGIPFREDSSNASDKYQRNYIRHKILPMLEEVFPKFRDTLSSNIQKLNDTGKLYQHSLQTFVPQVYKREGDHGLIHIGQLLATPAPQTILYEILTEFNFTPPTIDEVFDGCHAETGTHFYSSTHKIVKDREFFIIGRTDNTESAKYYIEEGTTAIQVPISLTLNTLEKDSNFEIIKNANVALLDYDKLTFPLILRKWHAGDYFVPLGMSGMKKLSDFFIDQKLSLFDKEKTWIIASGEEIVWIVGRRIDNRFKVMEKTGRVLQIKRG